MVFPTVAAAPMYIEFQENKGKISEPSLMPGQTARQVLVIVFVQRVRSARVACTQLVDLVFEAQQHGFEHFEVPRNGCVCAPQSCRDLVRSFGSH